MKVAIILGSARKGRQTHKAAYYLHNELQDRDIKSDLIDLAETSLPIFEEKLQNHPDSLTQASKISQRMNEADALIFITPEYHGSISGVLKNTLDYFWSELQKKPIGAVATSSGKMGGINASRHLQQIILSIGAFPMPLKWLVPRVHRSFDENYCPKSDKIESSGQKFLDEFLWFADALYQKKIDDALRFNINEEAA
ncbi:NADPH-dependent FMN reductase [Fodinibius salsisoli]|uniref:NAD(P)H-dependent oxidoreductase n=1 Tax=Fodinibius salsisoli TaxID=2820877 RepID=A0ABT3PHW6_9BACT|nr:NAD(P)H-dependent oxidoreductase [Fodinibius salsisoli]MCW9705507.1 NAD(P)H-dependent oxidoreductase [Fodinibius salsisoli]